MDDFLEFLLAYGVTIFMVSSVYGSGLGHSACVDHHRANNLEKCLAALRQVADDRTLFWFGEKYTTSCNGANAFDADCYNPSSKSADSLVSRAFQEADTGLIDTFLEVSYRQVPGSYFGCGNDFEVHESNTIDVDPLSVEVYRPWQLRDEPVYSWRSSDGDYYTFIFFDVGFMHIKSVIINIPGDDVTAGETILPYEGPLNPTRNKNPYMFILYRQSEYLELGSKWRNILHRRSANINLSEFATEKNLTGPVAINWILVKGDAYAAEIKRRTGYMNTCPHFVNDALTDQKLNFLPEKTRQLDLSVFMNVTLKVPQTAFNSCCVNYEYPATTLALNPLGDGNVKAVYVRTDVQPEVELSMATAFPNQKRDFKGKLLTLMVLDSDSPYPMFGDKKEPFLHWLVVNIEEADVSNGEIVKEYVGPAPPNPEPHTYHYLLFEQTGQINPEEIAAFTAIKCSFPFRGRCRFKSRNVIEKYNLKLIGATWHKTGNDEYVRHVYSDFGLRYCEVCKGAEGFSMPCSSANAFRYTTLALLHTIAVVCFLHFIQ
ncbi:hypothetical protein LOTGIDRAFT_173822 [Lottia gigantea]|uniref:Phosphatidylethanolamine-binding protein n=1 Tax=Lottia gigantea TaxID=225164 RepID=V4AVT8_LOTGI|nr:hypothetical protein LOTGIDRAFT_173822 [Lottia gigantea]ESO99180.1 hypothetical protein LOTGIDRAFT_173822 [Lottia gigantea]